MVNFSSQAMSLKTLVDINFHDSTVVSEDSRQFYRSFFRYHGDHRAVPIFNPVHMDAVLGDNIEFAEFLLKVYPNTKFSMLL